jgi:LacI family transcriptional regulator
MGRISPETREKILKVAADLDYRPNNLARGLRSQKSATVGLIVIGLTNSFYATILEGVESVATDSGYSVLIARTLGSSAREIRHLDVFREKRVDGVIVAPAHPQANAEYYAKLQRNGMPFVFIDRYIPDINADYVMTGNFLGAYMAGKHLVSLGR